MDNTIQNVCIIDDAYDVVEPTEDDVNDLWGKIEFDENARQALRIIGYESIESSSLPSVVKSYLENPSRFNTVGRLFAECSFCQERINNKEAVDKIRQHIQSSYTVTTKGGTDEQPCSAQLVLLDWYLGTGGEEAKNAAITKAKEIHSREENKPIIVLMSSHERVVEGSETFRKASGLIAGMFYVVPKSELQDPCKLALHFEVLKQRWPKAKVLQNFIDALKKRGPDAMNEFTACVSDLSVTDYAFLQSASLHKDGQPLGDYLFWLFSTYLGHLLFESYLKHERGELDGLSFGQDFLLADMPSPILDMMYSSLLKNSSPHMRYVKISKT